MAALFTRLVPSRLKTPPTAQQQQQQEQQSKLSSRFGDVQITAPTPGGWSHYESTRSIESYSTIPNLDRLLSNRPVDVRPQSRRGGGPRLPPSSNTILVGRTENVEWKSGIGTKVVLESPKEDGAEGEMSPGGGGEKREPRKRASTFHTQKTGGVGTVTVNPPMKPTERSHSTSPRTMNIARLTHKRGHSRSPEESRRKSTFEMFLPKTRRSVSAGPALTRRPYADKDSDTETIFFDSEDEEVESRSSKRDSGFILDEIDINIVTPPKSLESPETEGWSVSQGTYASARKMRQAVEDAERRRREAELETENVRRLLAAVQEKKGRRGKGKGEKLWVGPEKELVPDAAEIWG